MNANLKYDITHIFGVVHFLNPQNNSGLNTIYSFIIIISNHKNNS